MEPDRIPMQSTILNKPESNSKMILVILGVVLATAVLVGGGTWLVMNQKYNNYKTATNKSLATMQKQVNDLKTAQKTIAISAATDWQTYKNTDYGFQLTFGTKWKGYTVKKQSGSGTALGLYAFSLPTTDPSYVQYGNNPAQVFNISVYNTTDYQTLASSAAKNGGPVSTLIMSQSGKSFAYSTSGQWPSDWSLTGGNNGDVQSVISTFKLN